MKNSIMRNQDKVYSFLSNFSINQLLDVIDDIKLIEDGYEIHYIVDTYDIMNYALPFTQGEIEKKNQKNNSHSAIAYDAIFDNNNKSNKSNLILLDEYKLELLSLKNQIYDKLKNFPRIKQKLIELLQSKGIESENNFRKAATIVKSNFDTIIALQIFVEYGDNIYQRFTNLLNNNLTIFEFDTGDKEFDYIANNIFDNTRTTKLTSIIYDIYVEKVKYKLVSMESDYERYNYLENSYRDIAVIDRIIEISKKFNKDHKEKKITFQYLSSAPSKTSSLFNILKDIDIDINYNFNRDIYQCFLLKSLRKINEDGKSTSKIIELLYNVLEQKRFIENSINLLDSKKHRIENEVTKNLNQLLLDSENDIKNTLLYNSYKEHSQTLNNALQQIKSPSQRKSLTDFFTKTNSFLNNDNLLLLNKFECATISIQKYRQTFLLSNRLIDNKQFYDIQIPFGKDIIRNLFQHLPILPFIHDNNEYTESINKVCLIITQSPNEEINNIEFNNTVRSIIKQLSSNPTINVKEITVEFLILSYLNLITKTSKAFELSSRENYNGSENEIIDALKAQQSIIKNSLLTSDWDKINNKLNVVERKEQFLKELDYLLLWLLRRNHNCSKEQSQSNCINCKYDEVISFGKDCISKHSNDGRFYHGLALAYHSKAYAKKLHCKYVLSDNLAIISLFDSSKTALMNSLEYYSLILKNERDKLKNTLIVKSIIAVHNTIADCYLRTFDLMDEKDDKLLSKVHNHISSIQDNFNLINEDIDDFPSINHTIAELHYFESSLHFEREEYQASFSKISEATLTVYNFEHRKENIPENFYEIIHDINKLRFNLFQKMKML
nr:hypothetical protein [uncultured Carboxylicivirga sp.]